MSLVWLHELGNHFAHTIDAVPSVFFRQFSPTYRSSLIPETEDCSVATCFHTVVLTQLSTSLFVLYRLEEGQYLITHKAGEPFVTILKAAAGKASWGVYNLQQVHNSVPQPPSSGLVPWVPVDPTVVLPFHQKHGRVPCTFPPKPFQRVCI